MKLFAVMPLWDGLFLRRGRGVRAAVLALTLAGGCLLGAGRAQAQTTIDYYNFNNKTSGAAPDPLNHTTTGGSGPTNSAITNNFTTPTTNVVYFGGTTINAQNGDGNGGALSLLGGAVSGGSYPNNGDYIQLTTSTSNYTNIVLSYATQRTSTGFTTQALSYSLTPTDNNSYIPLSSDTSIPSAFALQTFDLSSVSGVNNASNIGFRLTFTGATSASGNNRIDNLLLQGSAATPAPPGIVSAGIGFAVTGFGALLRRRKQSKSADTATPEAAA